ncbi:hypothetical protein H4S07_006338, partial [Coemansia furcata]
QLLSRIDELAHYIDKLKGASDVAEFAAAVGSGEVPRSIVEASVGGVLAKAAEDKLEAVYYQLFAMATSASAAWRGLCVLNNLYNLAAVFEAMFVAAHGEKLKALGVDMYKASDKILGQGMPFAVIVQAIDVAESEVEVWTIDGKMNQVARTLLPTQSTYRTFGADQWKLLCEHLEQWNASLEDLQPVISNAKLIAQQQAVQMAGTSHVTIKE